MKEFKDIVVKYTHPAIPPMGIKVGATYTVGHLIGECSLDNSIKVMFTPINTTWEKLMSRSVKKNKVKEIVVEDVEEELKITNIKGD